MAPRRRVSKSRLLDGTVKTPRKKAVVCVLPVPISVISRLRFRPWGILKAVHDNRHIYLDFDKRNPINLLRLRHAMCLCKLRVGWVRYDRTNRGWHVIVRLRQSVHPLEIVALQAVLGSDPEREKFNLARVMENQRRGASAWKASRTNILFSRKIR